ncbi:MAG: metallophosphoesterase [Chloroflexota bacterium]
MLSPLHPILARLTSYPRFQPGLEITEYDVPIAGLSDALDGFTIAHISDLHVGNGRWNPYRVQETVQALQRVRPDVVVNTGDYLQEAPPIERVEVFIDRLLSEPAYGVERPVNLAVLGNHDYYAGEPAVAELREKLRELGVRLLNNETVMVERGTNSVSFTGLSAEEPAFLTRLESLAGVPHPHIALVHEAETVEQMPHRVVDLALAGHTHGGQVSLPGLTAGIIRMFNGSRYIAGWYTISQIPVYINRGLGCTGLPIRFRAAPELTFFRLRVDRPA